MENEILIQEYEKKLAEIQSQLDNYKKEAEAQLCALKEENKAEIEKINARYREELRNVLSARGAEKKTDEKKTGEKKIDTEDDDDDNDENNHDSRIKRAIKKLKDKYKIGEE